MAQAPRNKLCLARRSAGRMPCKPKSGTFSLREKSGSPPPRPRRYFRAAEIRYLARKQRTKCARQIYSPLSATAKICSFG